MWREDTFDSTQKQLCRNLAPAASGGSALVLLEEIKQFVRDAVERREHSGAEGAADVWRFGTSLTSYLRQLDERELRFLRRHTFHFTGDNYQRYLFGNNSDRDGIAAAARFHFNRLPGFSIDEGENGIGYETDFGLISFDLIRYISVVADLVESGALKADDQKVLLEIGGGYGGLARTALAYAPACSYVICDLEEMLFCSAVYLSNQCGAERVHLVADDLGASQLVSGHFYLLPQSNLEQLRGRFALALNQQSMQEMTQDQVERYCDFLADHATMFYSRNYPSLSAIGGVDFLSKFSTVKDLNAFLRQRFELIWSGPKETAEFGDAWLERLLLRCSFKM
jgi:putative sugar O-methyltransferase